MLPVCCSRVAFIIRVHLICPLSLISIFHYRFLSLLHAPSMYSLSLMTIKTNSDDTICVCARPVALGRLWSGHVGVRLAPSGKSHDLELVVQEYAQLGFDFLGLSRRLDDWTA